MPPTHATTPIDALSCDERFLARLRAGGFDGHVHSVFRRVVNVACRSTARLYTVACAETDNAPATLRVDCRSFDGLALEPGTPVTSDGRRLRLGSALEISLDDVATWRCDLPPWRRKMPVEWLRALIETGGTPGGATPEAGAEPSLAAPVALRLADTATALETAVAGGDIAGAYEHGRRLVGLGLGLTPAGDDYLVGLATVCHQPGSPVAHLRPVLTRLARDAAERTNDISHAAIAHAAEGRVRESISELVTAMALGDRAGMQRRGAQVLAIGATSGTDILTGVLAGLELAEAGRT